MSNDEKELEDRLVEAGNSLLAPPSDVEELLLLLDKAETLLSRVEQSPSESMSFAIHPAMKGLIAKELLGHSDADVKVAVASCISEITRITAPEAPYDDDDMKEIFQMIVKAFERLDDISSHTYSKRVSILETVAKVRSCVVMLDLECDALILEMFHHFLKTIRDNHPENVFSSMEVIMTLVLDESEDISSELISLLLTSVQNDKMDILPVARRLAEKVIGKCTIKLKPFLVEVVQSLGAPLSDYSKVVTTVCQENSDALEQNGLNITGECVADDSKFSERTVSDELAQGSGKMESEVSCPEVGAASGRSPKSVMSNGSLQTGNDGCLVEPMSPSKKSERSRRITLAKNASAARIEAEKPDLMDVKDTSSDHKKKLKSHKINSAIQSTVINDHSQNVDAQGDIDLPKRMKGRGKGTESSQSVCPSSEEMGPSTQEEHRKRTVVQSASDKKTTCIISPSSNEKLPDASRPKRGRPSKANGSTRKGGVHASGNVPISPSGSEKTKVIGNTDAKAMLSSKEQIESTSDSKAKHVKRSGKEGPARSVDGAGKQSCDSHEDTEIDVRGDVEEKHPRRRRKSHTEVTEVDTSGRSQPSRTKRQKARDSSFTNHEMVSSPKMAAKADNDRNLFEESLKSKSGKKRAREEVSRAPGHALKYDESLVGVRIKVWWPDDEQFYPGEVDSYDPISRKHKVSYFDGDEEILLLKNEHFEFMEDGEEDEEKNDLTPKTALEMPRKKVKKSDSSLKKQTTSVSSKSGNSVGRVRVDGTESEGQHGDDTVKSASGRRGGISKFKSTNDAITSTGSKYKVKADERSNDGTPKAGVISKNGHETPVAASKSNSRRGRKHKDDTPITGGRSKGDGYGAGYEAKEDMDGVGSKSRSDAGKARSNAKDDDTTRTVRKPKNARTVGSGIKSDGHGAPVKVNSGLARRQGAEDTESIANSTPGMLEANEGRSGKKRRKKSQG